MASIPLFHPNPIPTTHVETAVEKLKAFRGDLCSKEEKIKNLGDIVDRRWVGVEEEDSRKRLLLVVTPLWALFLLNCLKFSIIFIWVNPLYLLGIEIHWEDLRERCRFLIGRIYFYWSKFYWGVSVPLVQVKWFNR